MKKVTMKRALSLALAAAMAASVCSTALAEDAVPAAESAPAASEAAQPEQEAPAEPDAVQAGSEAQAESQPESEAEEAEAAAPEQLAESEEPGSEPAEQETAQQVEAPAEAETQETQESAESIAVQSDEAQEEAGQTAATVEGKEYDSLQAAFDAVSEGTVVLQQDIALQETATVAEGKKITLNLNGHKVYGGSYHSENGYHSSAIAVKGSLTIQDNSTAGEIYNESLSMPTHGVCLESTHAELIVESGKIRSSAYAVYAPVGTVTVNGGTIESTVAAALAAGGNANVIIYNGEIKAGSYDPPIRLNDAAQLTIYGGKISANSYADGYRDVYIVEGSSAKASISGGIFGKEPLPEQIAAGYEAVEKDGVWVVQKFEPVATVNGTGYKTLQEAFAAAKSNEVITLTKSTAENITVPAGVDYILNLNANTLTGTITIPEKGVLAVQGGSMAASSEEAVLFDNSGLLHIVSGNYSAKNLFKVSANAKIEVEHGYFGAKVDAKYLVEGKICKKIGNADERYPFVVTDYVPEVSKPASTVVENEDLPEGIKDKANEAASKIAVSENSVNAVQDAVKAQTDALNQKDTMQKAEKALSEATNINYNPDVDSVRIVTEPQLKVKPEAVNSGESIQFDISLQYAIKATIAESNGDMNENNTVTLDTGKVENPPEMVIELNDVRVAEISAADEELFVKHEHGENTFYYTAEDVKRDESGYVTGLKFTNPNGFSAFTLLSDTRTVTLNEVNADGTLTAHTLRLNHVGSTLPYTAKDGYTFAGYQYTDADGNVQSLGTVLTDEMLSQFNGQTLNVTAVYTQNPSGSSSSSSSSSSDYVAPDDSVYYTCVKCGYHDWTATADGYQCDHCGYKEVVKQIAGYEHVKGVYEPVSTQQTQQANAKALSVSSTASPKTGDNTNLALAVSALALSLAGVGALVFLRKKTLINNK